MQYIQRQNVDFIKDFAFWPEIKKRDGQNIYDLRTYTINAGDEILS